MEATEELNSELTGLNKGDKEKKKENYDNWTNSFGHIYYNIINNNHCYYDWIKKF